MFVIALFLACIILLFNSLLCVPDHEVRIHIPHPDYNILAKKDKGIPAFFDFDVALIELKEDVAISATARLVKFRSTPLCSILCTFDDMLSQLLS